jgi:uncharacterized membrane protein
MLALTAAPLTTGWTFALLGLAFFVLGMVALFVTMWPPAAFVPRWYREGCAAGRWAEQPLTAYDRLTVLMTVLLGVILIACLVFGLVTLLSR